MGRDFVGELLEFVDRRECDFAPAAVYKKTEGTTVDADKRDGVVLYDLGAFHSRFGSMIKSRAMPIAAALGLGADLAPKELELCAYGDGGAFRPHHDIARDPARAATCVYYFSRTPRPFTGGQLRLHPWPIPLATASREMLDVEPECDSLVIFPSILPHEVLPVRSSTGAWSDRRFSLTCWLWDRARVPS
jgi:Rps23 Pro-64 3,4-dihydroxylase Tpa1-like proline 4-hydroxylase